MRKALLSICVLLLLISPLAAVENDGFTGWTGALRPATASMGNAGLFLRDPANVWRNPSLVDRDWHVVFPSVAVKIWNIEENTDVFTGLISGMMKGEEIGPHAVGFLANIPGGFKDFMDVEASLYLGVPYSGLGVDLGFGLMSNGNGDVTSELIANVNASFSAAGGYTFTFRDGYALSVGLGISGRYKMASMGTEGPDGIGIKSAAEVIMNTRNGLDIPAAINELFRNGINYSSGWAFPISLGVTATFPYGFTLGMTVSDINPDWYMYSYNEMDDAWAGDFSGGSKGVPFVLKGKTDIAIGTAWEMENFLSPYWLRVRMALDFVDIIGYWRDGDWKDFPGLVQHVRMGAELSVLTAFEFRVGLDRGYLTMGCGIDLWGNRLDLVYGVKSYGKIIYGDSLDYLSLVFTLGWEDY